MYSGVFFAIIVGLPIWTVLGILCGKASNRHINVTVFYAVAYAFCAIAYLPLVKWNVVLAPEPRLPELLWWIGLSGIFDVSGMILVTKAMAGGNYAVPWTLGQMAMVIPFLFGVIWGDHPSPAAWGGVTLMLTCVVALGTKQWKEERTRHSRGPAILALVGFGLLGLALTFSMIPTYWPGWKDESHLRTLISVLPSGITLSIVCVIRRIPISRNAVLYGIMAAITILAGYVFLYKSMDLLGTEKRAAICYPLAVGTCVIGVQLYSTLIKKEPLAWGSLLGIFGLILIVAGS